MQTSVLAVFLRLPQPNQLPTSSLSGSEPRTTMPFMSECECKCKSYSFIKTCDNACTSFAQFDDDPEGWAQP